MANWHRRMIHYEPFGGALDLERGTVAYHGDGVLTIDYGGICMLANPTRHRGQHDVDAPRTWPHAVLLSGIEHIEALADGTAIDPDLPIITPPGLVDAVSEFGFRKVHLLDTWCQIVLRRGNASVTITALPAGRQAAMLNLAMDAMVECRSNADAIPYRLYLSSGSATAAVLEEIADRCASIDLAVISMAPTRLDGTVVGFDTGQAVEIVHRLHPGLTIPVHRFDDVFSWTVRDFRLALARAGWSACIQDLPSGSRHVFTVPSRVGMTHSNVPRALDRSEPGLAMAGGS